MEMEMEMEQKLNKRFFSLGRGLRQIGFATLALIALTGPAQAATDEVVYFHTDALGSPVAAFSEAGEVCWTETYSPYGEKLDKEDSLAPAEGCGLLSTDVGYTGHVQDDSGLVYAQQRYYDPVIGRFMSTDPVAASASSPNMFGRYHYANNSPYRYTDPDGEIPLDYAVDGISVGISAAIYANEPTFWNGFALGVDSILAALPYVPAGIGLIRGVDKGVDTVSAVNNGRKFWTNSTRFQGNKVFQRDDLIDPKLVDGRNRSNLQRMEKGLAPIGPDGKSMNLHHMIQRQEGGIAEMTQTFHQKNSKIIHINPSSTKSGIDRPSFDKWRSDYWKSRANDF